MAADNAFPSPPKNALNLPGSQVDTVPPPPAYGAIPTTVPEPDTPQPMPYVPVPIWLQQPKPRRAVCCRFWKAVFVAIFLCFIIKAGIRRVHTGLLNDLSYPIPDDVTTSDCVEGSAWDGTPAHGSYPYSAHKSYDLPLSSDVLFLLARGALSAGSVQFSTLPLPSNTVQVDVELLYHDKDVLEYTEMCRLKREGNDHGIGFFTPRRIVGHNPWRRPFFNVHVYFPESRRLPLQVNAFETDLQNYKQDLGDLDERVYFNSLSLQASNGAITGESVTFGTGKLKTSNAHVKFGSLTAGKVDVHSSNGAIEGHYFSDKDMVLKTSNARIQATLEFGKKDASSILDVRTSNGVIKADITSHAAKSHIDVHTSNARSTVNVLHIPLEGTVELEARTSNDQADISIPPEYEGSYELRTSNSRTVLSQEHAKDPSGERRDRKVEERVRDKRETYRAGNVWWAGHEEGKDKGIAKVFSTNGMVTLRV